ncbi:thiol reductant ABC exporter subunit CydD [Mesorhizobium sp. CAU 1741]|uniref:thiol reductant ABC exporter subunit CydD n=1 Tax=Mesorhizobium sp. CAU 1741 TaxID=3140366 RepID=UPI00325AB49C
MSTTGATARIAQAAPRNAVGLRATSESRLAGVAPSTNRLAAVLQVVAALTWIPQAGLIAYAIGNIAEGVGADAALLPALGILLLGVSRTLLDRAGTRLVFDAARIKLGVLRRHAALAIAGQSPMDASRLPSGQVASALAEQAEAVVPWLARYRPLRIKAAAVPLVILATVLSLSWAAAIVLLVAAPLIPIFMALVGWRAKEASERQLVRIGDMNAFLLDRLRGLATIRALGAVNRTALRLRDDANALGRSTMEVLRIAFLSSAILELFAALGVAMVAVYVGFHLLGELNFGAWAGTLSLAEGLFILLLAPAFFEPLRDLSSVWHDRAAGEAGLAALERLARVTQPIVGGLEDVGTKAHRPDDALSVAIEELVFRYQGSAEPVFTGFNLAVQPGEHLAIMAPSGCGKSTLLALLAGLAPSAAGAIRLGGEPLNGATAARLRTRIAWLGQQPHVFSGTLAGNVALGRPDIDHRAVYRAMTVAHINGLAQRRGPSLIGENGAGLSGGETLRLALARAAAGEGTALILADEPTAHLDADTAAEVTDRLLEIAAGRTLIVATHDPVLAARMDRVITLPGHPNSEAKS